MSKKKFLIIDSRPYGLFSIFLHTIDNIKWAKDNEYIPVVRWAPGRRDPNAGRLGAHIASQRRHPKYVEDKNNFLTDKSPPCLGNTPGMKHCQCLYYHESGHNGSTNPWEYYFEPLNNYKVEDAMAAPHDISDIFKVGELDFELDNKFLIGNIHSYEPLVTWQYLDGQITSPEDHKRSKEYEHRLQVNKVIVESVRVRQNILDKVDSFYDRFFKDHHILGVHVRGTDKKLEYPHKALPLDAYLRAISQYVSKYPQAKIFVASDNNEAIEAIMNIFSKNQKIVYPATRMPKYLGGTPICLSPATGPIHGEECLIETLLLSKCHNLICTDSNVAAAALYMNPAMPSQFLNRGYG